MAFGDTYYPKQLLQVIKKLGYPEIISFHHGGRIHMVPTAHEVTEFGIKLLGGGCHCFISYLGEVYLLEKDRPDNVIVRCKRCYEVMQKESRESMFTLYWPETKKINQITIGEAAKEVFPHSDFGK